MWDEHIVPERCKDCNELITPNIYHRCYKCAKKQIEKMKSKF